MGRDKNIGKSYAIIVLYIFIGLSALLSVSLFLEKRYYPMTGWLIILAVFLFFAYIALWLKDTVSRKAGLKRDFVSARSVFPQVKKDENYSFLISTKDPVRVQAIQDALESNSIECIVFDQYSNAMMGFLPGVEMRIMVPSEDFESAVRIIEDL